MRWLLILAAAALALLWTQPAGAQYGDPCAGVQCPANSACMLTNVGAVCGCAQGYVPDGAGGCKLTRCTSNAQCGEGQACFTGRCVPSEQVDSYRKVGIGLVVPGALLSAAGIGFLVAAFVFHDRAQVCDDVLITICSTNKASREYDLYLGFMGASIAALAGGITMLVIGSVRLRRSSPYALAGTGAWTPYLGAVPGGAVAGLTGRF